jgi:hypothetical protein
MKVQVQAFHKTNELAIVIGGLLQIATGRLTKDADGREGQMPGLTN